MKVTLSWKGLLAILIVACMLALFLSTPKAVPTAQAQVEKTPAQLDLEHRQQTWVSALEWCESNGRNDALNKKDRDGTPSYSNFQWKPTTILYYGKMYGLIATSTEVSNVPDILKDYDLQRAIVLRMVQDKRIDFTQQFPDCVKRKIGQPPRK